MTIPVRPLLPVALFSLLCACQPAARATPAVAAASPAAPAPATTTASAPAPQFEVQPPPASGPTRATLAVGGSDRIANGRLRLLRVVNDSRCPKDAQCVWEGEVTLAFDFNDGTGNREFELSQRRNPTTAVGERSFTLQEYGPCPAWKQPASKQDAPKECATVVLGDALLR